MRIVWTVKPTSSENRFKSTPERSPSGEWRRYTANFYSVDFDRTLVELFPDGEFYASVKPYPETDVVVYSVTVLNDWLRSRHIFETEEQAKAFKLVMLAKGKRVNITRIESFKPREERVV